MKTLLSYLFLTFCTFAIGAEEFVAIEKSGNDQQHVAETRFLFEGEDCYAGKRSYSNLKTRVIIPRVYWDLYFDGELVATISPDQRALDYVRVPSGLEFRKNLRRFTLSKDGKALRIWDLNEGEIRILNAEELKLSVKDPLKQNPDFEKLMVSFRPRFNAPTKREAEGNMTKSSGTNK